MEALQSLKQICSSLAYKDLEEYFNKNSKLFEVIKEYHYTPSSDGLPVSEQVSDLLRWLFDSLLLLGSNKDDKLQDTLSLLLTAKVIITSLAANSNEDQVNQVNKVFKNISPLAVIVCSSHLLQTEENCHKTADVAKGLLESICKGCHVDTTSQLLVPSNKDGPISCILHNDALDDILEILLTKLETWPRLPIVTHWCLTQVKYPNLGNHISKILTLSFKIIDSHESSNKIIGLKCLYHIMSNTNATEMVWYGRCDVIFELLVKLFYQSEPELLEAVYPCILLNLKILKTRDKDRMDKHYDKVIQVILTSMEYESKQPLRRVHIAFLGRVVDCVGIHLLCYFKRFLEIVSSYLEVYDENQEEIRLNALKVLKASMLQLWPRVSGHTSKILKSLLKLIVDSADVESNEIKDSLLALCVECLVVLYHCDPECLKKTFQSLQATVNHNELKLCIQKVLQEVS